MAQYSTGTVSTTAGSATVTGSGTSWASYLAAGDLIQIDDTGAWYVIGNVASNTSLSLTIAFPSTLADVDYVAVTDFTPNMSLPLAEVGDLNFPDIYTRAMQLLDANAQWGLTYDGHVLSVLSTPPVAPTDGDKHIVGASATGAWAGHEDDYATWDDGASAWTFETPDDKVYVYDEDAAAFTFYTTADGWGAFTLTTESIDTLTADLNCDGNGLLNVARITRTGAVDFLDADGVLHIDDIEADGGTLALTGAMSISGALSLAGDLSISSASLTPLTITTAEDGAAASVATLYRNSASPAASDVLHQLNFDGNDSNPAQQSYAGIKAIITDPDTATGKMVLMAGTGGSLSDVLEILTTGISVTGLIDVDNCRFDGNTWSITDTNGNANITPNGVGGLVVTTTNAVTGGIKLVSSAGTASDRLLIYPAGNFSTVMKVLHASGSLSIMGSGGAYQFTSSGTNSGIYTSAPAAPWHVVGDITTTGGIYIGGDATTKGTMTISNARVAALAGLTVTQATLGNAVAAFKSTATNDDPTTTLYQARVTTADATATTLHSHDASAAGTYTVRAVVIGRNTVGAAGCSYALEAHAESAGGSATLVGSVTQRAYETDASLNATIDCSGGNIRVRVTGHGTQACTWHLVEFWVASLAS